MLKWVIKKLDAIQSQILLGQTARLRAHQLMASNRGLSQTEAEEIARSEAVASLRAQGVDMTSPVEVRAWSQRLLTRRDPLNGVSEDERNDLPDGCDYVMTAVEIRDSLKVLQQDAAAKGEEAYYKPEFLKALYPFIEKPSAATAIPLLQIAPFLRSYFEKCSPGGEFYEMRRLINEH